MQVKNTIGSKKTDLLKGTKRAKAPAVIDYTNAKLLAKLLDISPDLLDPSVKRPKFVKNDLLSAHRIAKALNIDEELIAKEMISIHKLGSTISVPGGPVYPMVLQDKTSHHGNGSLRVHPLAIRKFLSTIFTIKQLENKLQANNHTNEGR